MAEAKCSFFAIWQRRLALEETPNVCYAGTIIFDNKYSRRPPQGIHGGELHDLRPVECIFTKSNKMR